MRYNFKPLPELVWGISVAVGTVIFTELLTFDFAAVTNPTVWGLAILSGSIRAAAGAALAWLRPESE